MSQVNVSNMGSSGGGSITVNGTNGIAVIGSPVSSGGTLTISPTAVAAFSASLSVNTSSTGVVACNQNIFNIGSFYNTSTFIATAPYSGVYLFVGNVTIISVPSNYSNFSMTLNNLTGGISFQTNNCNAIAQIGGVGAAGDFTTNAFWIVNLNSGDQIQLNFLPAPSGSSTLGGRQGSTVFTSFSGSLMAPF